METGTFLQENVQEYLGKYFVPLRYDSGRDGEQFMRFSIRGTPTYIVLDAGGNEIDRLIGYSEADDFISRLDGARSDLQ
jgi:thiol:disulfide interchange protein